jgi:gliding motility-associated-like protein
MKNTFIKILLFLFLYNSVNAQVTNGLVAKYSFNNGTANDEVGTVNGIINNALLTNDRFGNPNHAVEFASNNSYIDFGDNFDLFSIADSSFSFSFWIQSLSANNALIINKYGNSGCTPQENQREFFIRINSNQFIEMLYYGNPNSSSYRGVQGDMTINDTCWHHIVINYNGNSDTNNGLDRVEIFVDNILNTVSFSPAVLGNLGDIQNTTSHLGLGISLNSNGQPCAHQFLGKLDDIRIYSRTLTTQEVDTLYNETNPTIGLNNPQIANFQIQDSILCIGACTNFTDSSTNCPLSWEWHFENANTSTSTNQNPTNICYSTAGTHDITLIVNNNFSSDTITKTITVIPNPTINLGNDTSICKNQTLTLDATYPNATYLWQDGSTNPTFTINQNGQFHIEVSNSCATVSDTIVVDYIDLAVDLGEDVIAICENEFVRLESFHPTALSYLWQDGSTESDYLVRESGVYSVQVTNACETVSDAVEVIVSEPTLVVNLGLNQNLCENETIILEATAEGGIWYVWEDSTTSPIRTITEVGAYEVTITNGCLEVTDDILIQSEDCCDLYIPNAITPNNDGINDDFQVYLPSSGCNIITTFSMGIYDRWGGKVFETNDINAKWDGTTRGKTVSDGVYLWVVQYNDGNKDYQLAGDLTIVR